MGRGQIARVLTKSTQEHKNKKVRNNAVFVTRRRCAPLVRRGHTRGRQGGSERVREGGREGRIVKRRQNERRAVVAAAEEEEKEEARDVTCIYM